MWAAGGDCASGSMAWPCGSHPPLSSHQTEGCIMAIVLSHLDDASSPQSLTVTCLSDNYHRNQLSHPPGSKGPCAGDWQAFNFASSSCCQAVPLIPLLRFCFLSAPLLAPHVHIFLYFCACADGEQTPVPARRASCHSITPLFTGRGREPLCEHPRTLPSLPVFCSFFPLFPLGGTLTSFVRTITPLTLGIKT